MKRILLFPVFALLSLCLSSPSFADSITLKKVTGDVSILSSAAPSGAPASEGTVLNSTDKVQTGPGASAEIKIGKKATISLADNTTWSIQEYNESKDSYQFTSELALGKLKAKVNKLPKGGAFSVRTPTSVASVRGTRFGVYVHRVNGQLVSRLVVFDNNVSFSNLQGGSAQDVEEDQGATGDEGGNISSPESMFENERENNFFNNETPASDPNTSSGLPENIEDMTQGEFALWLVKEAGALSKLPSAATGDDAIQFLISKGIVPSKGWQKGEKVSKSFLADLLGISEEEAEKMSTIELINALSEYVDSHLSQQKLNVFSATSSASSSVTS